MYDTWDGEADDWTIALGYSRSGKVPIVRGRLLQRSGLLCPRLRRQQFEKFRYIG